MTRTRTSPLTRQSDYDRRNLESAHLIVSDAQAFPDGSLAREWARRVIERLADSTERSRRAGTEGSSLMRAIALTTAMALCDRRSAVPAEAFVGVVHDSFGKERYLSSGKVVPAHSAVIESARLVSVAVPALGLCSVHVGSFAPSQANFAPICICPKMLRLMLWSEMLRGCSLGFGLALSFRHTGAAVHLKSASVQHSPFPARGACGVHLGVKITHIQALAHESCPCTRIEKPCFDVLQHVTWDSAVSLQARAVDRQLGSMYVVVPEDDFITILRLEYRNRQLRPDRVTAHELAHSGAIRTIAGAHSENSLSIAQHPAAKGHWKQRRTSNVRRARSSKWLTKRGLSRRSHAIRPSWYWHGLTVRRRGEPISRIFADVGAHGLRAKAGRKARRRPVGNKGSKPSLPADGPRPRVAICTGAPQTVRVPFRRKFQVGYGGVSPIYPGRAVTVRRAEFPRQRKKNPGGEA